MTDSEVVRALLSKYQNCRDSDTDLIIGVLQGKGANLNELQRKIIRDTNFESIRRERQSLQAEGLYPASPEIAKARQAKSKKVRKVIVETDSTGMQELIVGAVIDEQASPFPIVPIPEKKFYRPLDWKTDKPVI